jgi:hypothetical protein
MPNRSARFLFFSSSSGDKAEMADFADGVFLSGNPNRSARFFRTSGSIP